MHGNILLCFYGFYGHFLLVSSFLSPQYHSSNDFETHNCTEVKMVTRMAWKARPPWRRVKLSLPVRHFIIEHTVFGACKNMYACIRNVQLIQDYQKDDKGWSDIPYNFLIGGDGRVYEGAGWNYVGEHAINYNSISIVVAFMGNFSKIAPSKNMLDAAKNLIACGINEGYLTPTVTVDGAREATCTNSPGDRLYEIIRQWPNFRGKKLLAYTCDESQIYMKLGKLSVD